MNIITRSNLRPDKPAPLGPGFKGVFEDFFTDPFLTPMGKLFNEMLADAKVGVREGVLPIDIVEDPRAVTIRAFVPGYEKDDVTIELTEGVLEIKAEKKEEKDVKEEVEGVTVHRRELFSGTLIRRIRLPDMVLEAEVQAELKDGILTLVLPKAPEAKPKKIAIR